MLLCEWKVKGKLPLGIALVFSQKCLLRIEMLYELGKREKQQGRSREKQGRFYNSSLTVAGKIGETPPAIRLEEVVAGSVIFCRRISLSGQQGQGRARIRRQRRRRRRELLTTETELIAIAAAANSGLRRIPQRG
jgi:hypothetical protein